MIARFVVNVICWAICLTYGFTVLFFAATAVL